MNVKQIYELVNAATTEVLGTSAVVNEDLSNVVDIGTAIFNATALDNYVRSLVNHIGKVIFVNRSYRGSVPSVLMDAWEFGSVLEKVNAELPEATEDESWELTNGTSYDPNIFYKPTVSVKFFNKKTTFEIPMSFTEMQIRESFSNVSQLNGFISMLYNAVDKSMNVKTDALIMRTINNMIGQTVYADIPGGTYTGVSHIRSCNLLHLYNTRYPSANLTAAAALTDKDFLRFAALQIMIYADRIGKISTLFNVGGKDRFTDKENLHIVLLSDFASGANVYLQSETFHNELTKLPNAETVPYWQGTGIDYSFDNISNVNVTIGDDAGATHTVNLPGVIGVMFDRDALGVCNNNRRVTSNYNPKAEFYTNWYKQDAEYFNDLNENFVVFYIA